MGVELFGAAVIVPLAIACVASYTFSAHHGIYNSQRVDTSKLGKLPSPDDNTDRAPHHFATTTTVATANPPLPEPGERRSSPTVSATVGPGNTGQPDRANCDMDHDDELPIDPDLDDQPRRAPGRHRHARADILAVIALGGAIGATARYGIEQAIPTPSNGFPTATFVINIIGSLLLGFVVVISVERLPPTRYLRPFLATGVIGSFTTFSTFAVENVKLVHGGAPLVAAIYVPTTLLAGIAAAWVGIATAQLFSTPPHQSR